MIRENCFVDIPDQVGISRTTKPAVNDGIARKIFLQGGPDSKRRTAHKQNLIFSRKMEAVHFPEMLNFIGEGLCANRILCYRCDQQ